MYLSGPFDLMGRVWFRLCLFLVLAGILLVKLVPTSMASNREFPFDRELKLDADPIRGSKRVPGLQFSANGMVEIDLWCVSGQGQAAVTGDTLTIVPTALQDNQCSAERKRMDEELLNRLMQVTGWRWEGFVLVLTGPQSLRYRPLTN
ncbi:MAG: META domain-containing protein [Pseudorhodoplanes sp.]